MNGEELSMLAFSCIWNQGLVFTTGFFYILNLLVLTAGTTLALLPFCTKGNKVTEKSRPFNLTKKLKRQPRFPA